MDRPLRVLLDVSAVPDRPVGAGVYTTELARGLGAHPRVELHLLARRQDLRWHEIAPGAAAALHVVPDARAARLAWEQLAAPRAIAHLGIDVWHGPHYTMPLGLGPRALGAPAVVTVHDMTFFEHAEWHERTKVAFFRAAIRASARRAARIIAVSEYTANALATITPPSEPAAVIHHGVDHSSFRVETDPSTAQAERDDLAALGVREPFIAFAGTAEPRKNLPHLVHAFASLGRDDLQLVIAGGDGWGTGALNEAIAASGVASRVLRPGYMDSALIPALFRHAAAVAYPSHEEGFGLPALEALACGAPLVTSRGSALAEVVADAAVLVDPASIPSIADGLSAALDPARAADLRRRGPRQAADFRWERCVDEHVEVYRAACRTRVAA